MIECAVCHSAELVIVSRDADYGVLFDKKAYINDHLLQEFKERVSKKRNLKLYTKLSDALNKEFKVDITSKEIEEEEKIIKKQSFSKVSDDKGDAEKLKFFWEWLRENSSRSIHAPIDEKDNT